MSTTHNTPTLHASLSGLLLCAAMLGVHSPVNACAFHAIPPNRSLQQVYQDKVRDNVAAKVASHIQLAQTQKRLNPRPRYAQLQLHAFLTHINKHNEQHLPNFNYHQAIEGHFSRIEFVNDKAKLREANDRYSNDPLLISESNVLKTLLDGDISWKAAKQQGLVSLFGSAYEPQITLNRALERVFP